MISCKETQHKRGEKKEGLFLFLCVYRLSCGLATLLLSLLCLIHSFYCLLFSWGVRLCSFQLHMGGSESALASIEGFQVARVIPNSPAHVGGLIPYFDVIVSVDGLPLDSEKPDFFRDYVKRNKDKPITFGVYNLRIRAQRDVQITPTDTWGGSGLLGCSINWETAEACVEHAWHIVDVVADSPAFAADLMAQRDYLIGMQPPEEATITMFRDAQDFHNRLEAWRTLRTTNDVKAGHALLLLVYDSVDNSVKEVLVDMGRQLSLGVDVANGYLHSIPSVPGSTKLPYIKQFYAGATTTTTEVHKPKPQGEVPAAAQSEVHPPNPPPEFAASQPQSSATEAPMAAPAQQAPQPAPAPAAAASASAPVAPVQQQQQQPAQSSAGPSVIPPPMPPPIHFPTFPAAPLPTKKN